MFLQLTGSYPNREHLDFFFFNVALFLSLFEVQTMPTFIGLLVPSAALYNRFRNIKQKRIKAGL